MTPAPAHPRFWLSGRWWAAIALVFAIQVALFQLTQNRTPVVPRNVTIAAPVIRMSYRQPREWFVLEDPTLFALPHYQGFSGPAWLQIPPFEFHPADWTEPVRLLSLSAPELGSRFVNYVQTNRGPTFPTIVAREPRLSLPETVAPGPVIVHSTVRIEGELARRRLLSCFTLPAWPYTDLLTNSVVQVLVDARGNTVSAVLLPPGNSSRDTSAPSPRRADQLALDLAKAARFEPLPAATHPDPVAGLTVGRMIFEWETVPSPVTNNVSAGL
jgi:hypothetical protein